MKYFKFLALAVFPFLFFINMNAQEKAKPLSSFRDSIDNKIDISDWLITKKGVLLMPTIITEPAVGYGEPGSDRF